jgi:hypothetical protein
VIPDGPADVTAEWLTQALRDGGLLGNAGVSSLRFHEFGGGMAGRVARASITYDHDAPGAPVTLVAKFPAPHGPTRELGDLLRIYEREERFYRDLAPRLNIPVPRLYYASSDGRRSVLMLEDMAPADEGNLLAGSTLAEAEAIITDLARLHAAWWDATELERLPWLPSPNSEAVTSLSDIQGSGAWRAFHGKFGAHMPPDVTALGAWLARDHSVVDRLSAPPQTLVHGDMRVNNVLFSAGRPRAFIDWQTAVRGRGPIDVANLFVSSLQPGDRRTAEKDLLPRYHQMLAECGVRGYSFDQCWLDYRLAVVNQFSQVVVLSSLLDVEERLEDGVGAVTGARLISALLDLHLAELVVPNLWARRWVARIRAALRSR